MDKKTIYSKTGKGVLEIKNKAGKLSKDLIKVLNLVDGKSTIADLMAKAKFDDAEMDKAVNQLSAGGYIKEFANTSTGATSGGGDGGSYVDDLDFTSSITGSAKSNPYQSAQTEWRQRETADRAKAEQDAKKKRELEDQQKKEAAVRQAREEAGRLAKVEAERKAKEAAGLKMREETERKAKIEAEAMAQTTRDLQKILEAERKALEESERKKQEEAARVGKEEADRRAREDAERKRKEDEERQRKEAEERKRREEEDRKRKEEEERKRREEEERKRKEDEERKRREEEERKRREEEDRKRKEEEERKRKEEEERKRKEDEERRKREEEERLRREEEERKRKEEEERKRREDEERRRREEEEERKRKAEEERLRLEEEERKRKLEEERRLRREEEDRRRQEEDERRRKEDEELEAKDKAQNDLRRAEEDRVRAEEDERRRKDDELREREEAESRRREEEGRRAREEEESRKRREDDERKRRDEDEERKRREDDERRRKDEEERARASEAAAAKSAAPEFDLSGLKSMEDRIAAEFEKQQEELRKREEDEERRRDQDEQARMAMERAEREEEARQEAERRESEDRERRERMERERMDREERERKRQEEKEQRIKEQEERKVQAAQERQRQEEMKVEAERRAREEALAGRRKEQEERDRKRAEVQALKKSKAIKSPIDRLKPVVIGVVVLLVLVIGGVQLVPMNNYIPAIEKLASDHIKEPVTIGSVRVSILGGFSMSLDSVKLGTTQDVKIDKVTLSPALGSLFGEVKSIDTIELETVTVAQEVLPRLPKWLEAAMADKNVQVERVLLRNVKLESRSVAAPSFDATLQIGPDGSIQGAKLNTTDGKLTVDLVPKNGEVEITLTADKGWTPPVGPQIEFTDLSATAVASHSQVRVTEFKALFYSGAAKGTALINWGGPWSVEGEVSTERVELQELMPVFTRDAKSTGQLESRFRYAMVAPDLATLFDQPRIDGSFTIKKGDLDGVDLVRALQMGGRDNVQGGATRFEEITGTLSVAGSRYQYRNLKLGSGLLSATGGFEIMPNKEVSGRTAVELRSQAAQIRGNFNIDGSLKAIVLKPN